MASNFSPVISMDVLFEILDILDLSLFELAPYRRCCRAMRDMMTLLVKRLDSTALPALRVLNDDWVVWLTRLHPNIEVVQLNGVDIGDNDTTVLVSSLPRLREVDFFNCTSVGDLTVMALIQHCPNLQSLTLGGSLRRHGATVTNGAIIALAEQCVSLRDLHLTSCYQVSDDSIVTLANLRGPGLRSISLSRCARITDASIIQLAENSLDLQSVTVNECFRLTSAALIALASSCQHLLSVNVRGTRVTDAAIQALAMKCPLLEAVNLECCLNLTDAGVMTLGTRPMHTVVEPTNEASPMMEEERLTASELMPPPPARRTARTSSPDPLDRKSDLSEEDFDSLFAMRLRTLSVSGCVRLTDASIVSVAQSCHNLATVDLSQVYDLTDASVVALASNCGPHLRSLKLSRCGRITDNAIASVAGCCPGLRAVWVDDCYGLTDNAIDALAVNCHLLEALDMSHCAKLTDASVFSLCEHSHLNRIEMRFPQTSLGGPSLLTPDAVIALANLARQPGSLLRFVDLTGHPKLLTPAAANAIALAEQPLHHHGHTEDNGGGGGSGGGGSTPHVVFLVDEYEEEEREDASYYNGDFTSSEPFNFSAFSNDLPFLKNLNHASSSDISNSDSMSGGSVEEDKPVRVPVVSFSLPSDEPLSPPPSSSSSSPSSSSTENKGGNLRGKAKQFMRSLNIFGNSRRRERESESDGPSPSAAAAADNSNPSWPNELSPRRRGSFKEKKKRRK